MSDAEALEDKDDAFIREVESKFALISLQEPGDVILIRPKSVPSAALRLGQALLSPFFAFTSQWDHIPSHALLVVDHGLYLHAMPGVGVRHVRAEQYPLRGAAVVAVFRRRMARPDDRERLLQSSGWHYAQGYNYKLNFPFLRSKSHSASYCSELVASVYERAALPVFRKTSRSVLPIDLLRECQSSNWIDVTEKYLKFEELLAAPAANREWLTLCQGMAESQVSMQYEFVIGLRKVDVELERLQRSVVSNRFQRAFQSVRSRLRTSKPVESCRVDICAFLAPLCLVAVSSGDPSKRWNTWLRDGEREAARRVKEKRAYHRHICEDAFAYALAACMYLSEHLEGKSDNWGRVLQALSFDEQIVLRLRSHDFAGRTFADVPDADREILFLWKLAVEALMDLHRVRELLEGEQVDKHSLFERLKLERGMLDKWFASGIPARSRNPVNVAFGKFLQMLHTPEVELAPIEEDSRFGEQKV